MARTRQIKIKTITLKERLAEKYQLEHSSVYDAYLAGFEIAKEMAVLVAENVLEDELELQAELLYLGEEIQKI